MTRQEEAARIDLILAMRKAQKVYFARRNGEALEAMRAAEHEVRKWITDNRSATPEGFDIFSLTKNLLDQQKGWINAQGWTAKLRERNAPEDEINKSIDQARRLQGTCQAQEKRLDKTIEAYRTPTLPGLT